ncbi:hypothetical protein [Priestia aryabhattai]
MGVKFNGFDELNERLNDMSNKADELNGENQVELGQLLNEGFMQANTNFDSLNDMFEKSPFDIKTSDDFEAIPQGQLDEFISNHSKFSSWNTMLETASTTWVAKQLGF